MLNTAASTSRRSAPVQSRDPALQCDVQELAGDSGWDRWQELAARQDAGFAPTLPGSFLGVPAPAPAPTPRPRVPAQRLQGPTVDDVLLIARRQGRVCPLPVHWWSIFERLPDRPAGLTPPLEGRAWTRTGSLAKRIVLREQIEWAATTGTLGLLRDLLAALPEAAWHHMGD
ncbi:MAG TPA: hypothetical protein VHA82_09300 [Ramlibacter sp.]|uniref:hypothetical protein n=1 Tax=Ramlibacter sp. TaxID=1917967 RepID=UPI002CE3434F|nr:hypothetical protein [Ramlibacter sp.]HVZ43994.1 hypothetical protein [Ramlibacter sp.]